MARSRSAVVVAGLAIALLADSGPAAAGPDAPSVAAIQQKEKAARAKAGQELAGFARFCATNSAFEDARHAYAKAIAINPAGSQFKSELAALRGKTNAPTGDAATQIDDRETKCLAACEELLEPVADAYAQADSSDELARLVALMRVQRLPVEAFVEKRKLVWFEPYLDWRRKQDVEKLEQGWEIVDGAWVDPKKVADLDKAHSTWARQWVVADDVHEIHTTVPLRVVRQLLARIGAYRRFLLQYFAGEWDLAAPKKKLPVIAAPTRAEMEERLRIELPGSPAIPPQVAAYFVNAYVEGSPCVITFEVRGADGVATTVDARDLRWNLEHEIGHQVAFEYSRHAGAGGRPARMLIWAIEALADSLPSYDLVQGVWVERHPRFVVRTQFCGPAWCHDNVNRIPPLAQFIDLLPAQFTSADDYHVAAGLGLFLLEGKDRAHRAQFVKLLEIAHQSRSDAKTFSECFKDTDVATLDAEFRAWCKAFQIDAK